MEELKETTRYSIEDLSNIPLKSGVYLMVDSKLSVIYVGKATKLRTRVSSYFRSHTKHSPKNKLLVSKVASIDIIVTQNEVEALILENILIKKYKPKFNINLKDDKSYPFIKITIKDNFPRIVVSRNFKKDGSIYFGPYTSAGDARQIVRVIEEYYSLRRCSNSSFTRAKKNKKPCINYQIGGCVGICIDRIDKNNYGKKITEIRKILRGNIGNIIDMAEEKMRIASENYEFEKAAFWRDRAKSIKILLKNQKIVDISGTNYDTIALFSDGIKSSITLMMVRDGKLFGKRAFIFDSIMNKSEIIEEFIGKFYSDDNFIPEKIVVQELPENSQIISKFLSDKCGYKVLISLPTKENKSIFQMAHKNSQISLKNRTVDKNLLIELKDKLKLKKLPRRIECYDISNISGTLATGSQVVFIDGLSSKNDYRKYKIKSVKNIDDYAMMEEMIRRRCRKIINEEELPPDLMIIDGGLGHLNRCVKVLKELKLDMEIISIAKKEEELFKPGEDFPIVLSKKSRVLYLIQRIRDETHRFAITYHRKLRANKLVTSSLEEIRGIGKKKVLNLFEHFGSVENMMKADIAELMIVPGIHKSLAEDIVRYFKNRLENGEKTDAR